MSLSFLGVWQGFKELKHVHSLWLGAKRVHSYFRGPVPGILIVGPGGVGKSTLLIHLQGDYDYHLSLPPEYEESFGIEVGVSRDGNRLPLIALPGQALRRISSWPEAMDEVAEGKYAGIIFVSANGYESMGRTSIQRHKSWREGDTNESFLERMIIHRRTQELKVLDELEESIAKNLRPMWFLTFVCKQDLWWEDRTAVEYYYRHGNFAKRVAKLGRQKTARQWRNELLFGAFLLAPFVAGHQQEVLKFCDQNYGQHMQIASVRRLKEMVKSLTDWNKKR